MTADEYVPDEEQVRAWCRDGTGDYPDVMDEWLDRFLARVKRDAAREALDGLSTWLGELAERHPARSSHVPLMQAHITRYTTDHYPEETP